ncbi:hypothetical protein E1A91_D02G193000v1 [Gossypium mustelinum]|uniref:Protein kinase domain-containing protein n=1 Tax=Gossypium mustelinum TaxID=34275 RepID=A0A5D2VYN0_GOSMU|nr:hypothetical protein E1A91_D02G193000v1 [Gossypium mustelinum]
MNVFVLFATLDFAFSLGSVGNCILDIKNPSPTTEPNCELGNWGGFINSSCCGGAFEQYLLALGRRASLTNAIYLNSTQQSNCLTAMASFEKDVYGCGIQKLTSGASSCSDYTITDVIDKLGDRFRNFQEDCKVLGTGRGVEHLCNSCLRRWEEINGSSDYKQQPASEDDDDICRFAALVSMISNRVEDENWVYAVFQCLRGSAFSLGNHIFQCFWVLIGGLAGALIIVVIATWICYRKRKEQSLGKGSFSAKLFNLPKNRLLIDIAHRRKVYKGLLSNGQYVAIKHIINDGQIETFVREVRSLSHIKHPNLVALVGYCENEDECFLVYELCHHGNLSEWLYGKDKGLSWIQRLKIAIDSARGLWFLHTYPEGSIVHRDIKPTNILINDKFQAKLADFGLSKVMDIGQSHVSSEVRGTFGYVDPEYRRNHRVNVSGDVYSFGIVLLQLLSGQRVLNMNLHRPLPLSKMAKVLTREGDTTKFADPKLNGEYSLEAFDLVLKLALSCIGIKQERPSMEQVVLRLQKALNISIQAKPVASRGKIIY